MTRCVKVFKWFREYISCKLKSVVKRESCDGCYEEDLLRCCAVAQLGSCAFAQLGSCAFVQLGSCAVIAQSWRSGAQLRSLLRSCAFVAQLLCEECYHKTTEWLK